MSALSPRLLALAALLVALPAAAADDDPFADLFGDPAPSENLDDLRKATGTVKSQKKKGVQLKEGAKLGVEKKVELVSVFASPFIKMHIKRGCIPAGRRGKKITALNFDDLPARADAFSTCLHIKSETGRQMRMSVSIVGPRNKRVAKAETVIDFSGKPELDHILDFPEIRFTQPGQYAYWVELDGKKVGTLPLFKVNVVSAP